MNKECYTAKLNTIIYILVVLNEIHNDQRKNLNQKKSAKLLKRFLVLKIKI